MYQKMAENTQIEDNKGQSSPENQPNEGGDVQEKKSVVGSGLVKPGRLARLPPEERSRIARLGGKASKPLVQAYTKCIECEFRYNCKRAFEEFNVRYQKGLKYQQDGRTDINQKHYLEFTMEMARCVYEMEGKKHEKSLMAKRIKAFVGDNPDDMQALIHDIFETMLDQAKKEPSFAKSQQMLYALNTLMKTKYGEARYNVNINQNQKGNTSIDVKQIMKEIRHKKQEIIDIDIKEETKESKDKSKK